MDNKAFGELYNRMLDTSKISNKRLNVAYGAHERHRLDLYYPEEGRGPWPLIVFYHGGAFVKGDKARYQLAPALQGVYRGYAVASVNYRLATTDPVPACFADARAALRYLKAHAEELDIDSSRIALWGESAGAELACYTGLVKDAPFVDGAPASAFDQDCKVSCVVDWYAPLDLLAWQRELVAKGETVTEDGRTLIELICGVTGDEMVSVAARVDPQNYLKPGICPVLIEHGAADDLVNPEVSVRFRENLLRLLPEEDVPFRMVDGGKHGVADYQDEENLDWVFGFIDRNLR